MTEITRQKIWHFYASDPPLALWFFMCPESSFRTMIFRALQWKQMLHKIVSVGTQVREIIIGDRVNIKLCDQNNNVPYKTCQKKTGCIGWIPYGSGGCSEDCFLVLLQKLKKAFKTHLMWLLWQKIFTSGESLRQKCHNLIQNHLSSVPSPPSSPGPPLIHRKTPSPGAMHRRGPTFIGPCLWDYMVKSVDTRLLWVWWVSITLSFFPNGRAFSSVLQSTFC